MEPLASNRSPVLVPFRCPRCAAEQSIDLVAFSRAGTTACQACNRRLSREQVSQAIENARRPAGSAPPPRRGGRLWA